MLPEETLKKLEKSQEEILRGIDEMEPEFQKSLDAFLKFGRDFRAAEKRVARRLSRGTRRTPDIYL